MRRGVSMTIGIMLILLAAALVLASTAVHAADGRIRMQSIRVPESVRAGEPIHLSVGLKQIEGQSVRRINTKAYIVDAGEIAIANELPRLRSRSSFVDMMLDTDNNLPPGEYLIRFYASAKTNADETSQKRTKTVRHRWITVE